MLDNSRRKVCKKICRRNLISCSSYCKEMPASWLEVKVYPCVVFKFIIVGYTLRTTEPLKYVNTIYRSFFKKLKQGLDKYSFMVIHSSFRFFLQPQRVTLVVIHEDF